MAKTMAFNRHHLVDRVIIVKYSIWYRGSLAVINGMVQGKQDSSQFDVSENVTVLTLEYRNYFLLRVKTSTCMLRMFLSTIFSCEAIGITEAKS